MLWSYGLVARWWPSLVPGRSVCAWSPSGRRTGRKKSLRTSKPCGKLGKPIIVTCWRQIPYNLDVDERIFKWFATCFDSNCLISGAPREATQDGGGIRERLGRHGRAAGSLLQCSTGGGTGFFQQPGASESHPVCWWSIFCWFGAVLLGIWYKVGTGKPQQTPIVPIVLFARAPELFAPATG